MANEALNPSSILSQATNGTSFSPEDSFIAVMGVTGSGKSTFISRVTGLEAKIGHDLVSCTSEIESFGFQYNSKTVHLIDTPGFDDTYRSDSDVLKDIAFWLSTAYRQRVKLSGIVYLHPIDRNRITGAAYKNLRMFNKLCGAESMQTVVLATTMWKHVAEGNGERRQEELKSTPDFWGEMVAQGSHVFRHDDSRESAMKIISYLLDQQKTTILQVQRQMVDEGMALNETSAGQELEKELIKQRELFAKRLKEAQEEMDDAIAENDRRAIEEAATQQQRFQQKLDDIMKGSEDLKISMQKLLEQKNLEQQHALQSLELAKQQSQDEARKASEEVEKLKRQMAARSEQSEEERRNSQKEIDEMSMRVAMENAQSRRAYQGWMATERAKSTTSPTSDPPTPKSKHKLREGVVDGAESAIGEALGTAAVTGLIQLVNDGDCSVM